MRYTRNGRREDVTGEMNWGTFGTPESRPKKRPAPPDPEIKLSLTKDELWAVSVLVRGTLAGGFDPVLAKILEKLKGVQ